MIERDGAPTFEDVQELLNRSELTDVVLYEHAGRRVDDAVDDEFSLQVLTRVGDTEFEIRCKVTAAGHGGQYLADAGAVFTLQSAAKIEEGTAREFAEKVGVMAVYPYLRAAVSQSAASLGLDRPILPLLRAGGVKLTESMDSAEDA
ncbi:SecB-like chaperone SecBL [Mycolicibacterium smegmatis]|jgi:hypothetical protein|uniref:Preprotein translocase subunit SecB n=1 Tax=Mycolicibacterium smegmatis (strain MKD8) TaxID=1214915 RepID=A0A2U9PMZ1_MYCSE|nr:SecB-like chaperone SecBL [Mycolicibacterium smegmatis]AWT53103.1 hypothetical protein D806_021220 [Mycolicibacterium smegmatis MKD8]MCP2622766.1 SecB-like chaperone SecBL [Mycolicibacterium smegmatis]MDF1903409.1 SecB-like chaperone SecBL [Mycolicibacterium smegmatis]MDF1909908.1 SecB-like chaperone SecBL [Mycolicibacterium smegmatis]MDF1919130.1 SecB-like chaperone SecBL [Mycolicibacterium smegmatis]